NIMAFNTNLAVDYSPQTTAYNFGFYFGPNSFAQMKSYDMSFQKLIPLGWGIIRWINRFVIIPSFDFLGHYMTNYGWIIFLLTLFIKLIIFPFTYKSYISMAKMRLLKPEMDSINQKYPKKDDAMKKQQELMALYSKAGVSPMGGCLPMLFQLPVLIAMFRFFPASIELRGEHFLWATDLSSYDSILALPFNIPFYGNHVSLFALLMGVSTFISTKINMAQSGAQNNQQLPGMAFMTTYLMPVMLVVWFNSYSCALSYYYLLSNVVTIGQTYLIRQFVDDKKLHQQMKDNAKKPKKKNRWQQRYDDMIKQQQELASRNTKKK
ncbi:MAG: membrane protein insertase YidC, partial [Rikenellaceae bacterium]